jgi:hypothetical protein
LELAAIPAALTLGALLQLTQAGRFLVAASAEMEMHELGHATASWLAGRMAIPLPMFTLGMGLDRSFIAFALTAAALAWLARAALREHLPAALATALVLGATLLTCTAALSAEPLDAWVKYAGVGGEFWLSALLLIAFHQPLPAAWRWARSRWFFAAWGALAFTANARRWLLGEIPWGSFWGGDGDMELLRDACGWSDARIIHSYRTVGVLCLALVLAQVAWRARRR